MNEIFSMDHSQLGLGVTVISVCTNIFLLMIVFLRSVVSCDVCSLLPCSDTQQGLHCYVGFFLSGKGLNSNTKF